MERANKTDRVEAAIARWIAAGRFAPGERLPAEPRLMEEFGVSRVVVRRAIGRLVEQGRLDRRHGSGTFVVDAADVPAAERRAARAPASGSATAAKARGSGRRPRQIAFFIPPQPDGDNAYQLLLEGLEEKAHENGLTVALFNHRNSVERVRAGVRRLAEQGLRLAVFVPLERMNPEWANRRALGAFERAGMRVVLADKPVLGGGDRSRGFVGSNGYDAMRRLVGHLAELGHRRIGCVMNNFSSSANARVRGFLDAMRELGLPLEREYVRIRRGGPDEPGGHVDGDRAATEAMLKLPAPPTAVVCLHDWVAFTVCDTARRLGFSIPDDLSVTGFDDLPLARKMTPPLTTVRQPFREIGHMAVELALEEYVGGGGRVLRHFYLDAEFVRRASTAPPRQRKR